MSAGGHFVPGCFGDDFREYCLKPRQSLVSGKEYDMMITLLAQMDMTEAIDDRLDKKNNETVLQYVLRNRREILL